MAPAVYEISQTDDFKSWIADLRDASARAVIARRIDRMRRGNFGDHHSVGQGVSELVVHYGPGYRVYYVERKGTLVILLCGGDKGSQRRDIRQAQNLATEV